MQTPKALISLQICVVSAFLFVAKSMKLQIIYPEFQASTLTAQDGLSLTRFDICRHVL